MRRVRDLMHREVGTVTPEATVTQVVRTMEAWEVSEVPVVDCWRRLLGVVSVRDVLLMLRRLQDEPEAMQWGLALADPSSFQGWGCNGGETTLFPYYVTSAGRFVDVRERVRQLSRDQLTSYTVGHIMKGPSVTIEERAGLPELAQLLRNRDLHRALVVKDRRVVDQELVGVVSVMDLLEGLWGRVPYAEREALATVPPAVGCVEA